MPEPIGDQQALDTVRRFLKGREVEVESDPQQMPVWVDDLSELLRHASENKSWKASGSDARKKERHIRANRIQLLKTLVDSYRHPPKVFDRHTNRMLSGVYQRELSPLIAALRDLRRSEIALKREIVGLVRNAPTTAKNESAEEIFKLLQLRGVAADSRFDTCKAIAELFITTGISKSSLTAEAKALDDMIKRRLFR